VEDTPIHPPYKVLIVDDSAIVRGLVTRMLQEDDDIEVVGSVANGEDALGVMRQEIGIEAVVLDIEMPVMDGLTALPKLLEIDPTVRVIMASTLTKRNADISFQAMTLGAVDYIPKPSSAKDLNVGEGFRAELLDKVKAWAEQRRKMLGADQARLEEIHEEQVVVDDVDTAERHEELPESAAPEDDASATEKPAGDAPAPFRAELSAEHQILQKPGRVQRKRFTAELRPRPTHQPGRLGPMSTRPMPQPQHPQHVQPVSPAQGQGKEGGATTINRDAATQTTNMPARDPGRLIREAAIAAGDAKATGANVKPSTRQTSGGAVGGGAVARNAPVKQAPQRAAPAARSPAAAAAARAKAPTGAAAPAPAKRVITGGQISLLPEKRLNVEAIAIGSSTGGPQALFEVLRGLAGVRQPIFITQHMPATFTTILAEHITRLTGLKCQEGQTGMQIQGGQVYLAPGDYHMVIEGRGNSRKIVLNQNPPENFCRPSVDPMLRSLVESYGGNILTAILTGMGQDGMLGGRAVVGAGGMVVAQDEQTSVVWGMPGAAAHAGICSAVLPVGGIAAYIKKFAGGR
jgi:two-component system chemotaxis response regulator CheB